MRSPVVLFVLVLLLSSAFAQSSGGWLRNDLTGCHVWNSRPESGVTFNWSGNCSNNVADGPGMMQWYVNGSPSGRFVGEYDNGEPREAGATRGEKTFADGSRYEGDFHRGKMSGWGVFTTKAGDRYEGEFADDRPNGFGTYKEADGSTYAGLWKNGCFRQRDRVAAVMATEKECSFGVRGRPY